jgi:succinate dehydrogenase / fumarate reductase flavoprotein subunit
LLTASVVWPGAWRGTLAWLDFTTRKVTIDYRRVHTYTMTNDVQYIEPKARVY